MAHQHNILSFPTPTAFEAGHMSADLLRADAANPANALRSPSGALRSVHTSSYSMSMEDVKRALEDNRLVVHYQPQFDVETGRPVAAEALIRLLDEQGELVMPERFLPEAERDRLIVWLGRAVLRQAFADMADMRQRRIRIDRVAVKVTASQVELDVWLPDFIQSELAGNGLRHIDLELELTDGRNLSKTGGALERLTVLSDRGCRIVLDEVSVGHTSPDVLRQLRLSAIRLDPSLLQEIEANPLKQETLQSVMQLAGSLGLEVIAEGVESARQQIMLRQLGCDLAQGFGYARPMTAAALMGFMVANTSLAP
ncbi:MAG: EAL domain-containing protein [Pseudomonadota bacterium]